MNWGKLAGKTGKDAKLSKAEFRVVVDSLGITRDKAAEVCGVKIRALLNMLSANGYEPTVYASRLALLERAIQIGDITIKESLK